MRTPYVIRASLCAVTALAQAREAPVTPGQEFVGPILTVRVPNSGGRKLLESSSGGMIFARPGASSEESYIAAVTRIPLPETQSAQEFEALIKHEVEKDAPLDRFQGTDATFETSSERGYVCVLYNATTEDTKAKSSLFHKSRLILQLRALYCRPPNMEKAGFAVTYSHRGLAKVDDFDAQTSDFIDGIQVPHG